MKLQSLNMKSALRKAVLVAAGLGAVAFAGAPRAQAGNPYDCQQRVEEAQYRLEEAIENYGYYSSQANFQRHELLEEQRSCQAEAEQWNRQWRDNGNYDRNGYYGDRGYRNNNNNNYYYGDRGYRNNRNNDEDDED
ncbi:MAG TPA: hypothetical protein VN982_07590 [Candidatus Dormibacteraeota bacterium]|nr:hypothetical protein [Candidatus Dormibacteraeota bacterium]